MPSLQATARPICEVGALGGRPLEPFRTQVPGLYPDRTTHEPCEWHALRAPAPPPQPGGQRDSFPGMYSATQGTTQGLSVCRQTAWVAMPAPPLPACLQLGLSNLASCVSASPPVTRGEQQHLRARVVVRLRSRDTQAPRRAPIRTHLDISLNTNRETFNVI